MIEKLSASEPSCGHGGLSLGPAAPLSTTSGRVPRAVRVLSANCHARRVPNGRRGR